MAVVGVKRGDIWLVDLNPVRGSEQRGVRPCLVISNDVVNQYAPTVCVIVETIPPVAWETIKEFFVQELRRIGRLWFEPEG